MKTKAQAKKVAATYAAKYNLFIEVDSRTVTVWHGDGCDWDLPKNVAAAIAAMLSAAAVTSDGSKSIVWYKDAPTLDLDNVQ